MCSETFSNKLEAVVSVMIVFVLFCFCNIFHPLTTAPPLQLLPSPPPAWKEEPSGYGSSFYFFSHFLKFNSVRNLKVLMGKLINCLASLYYYFRPFILYCSWMSCHAVSVIIKQAAEIRH